VNRYSIAVAALGLSITILSGCKKDIQSNEAVRQGVVNYLSKRPDLLAMDVSVGAVNYKDNEATATVHFQAKGNNTPGGGMTMQYVLARQGDQWVVKGKAAGESHGEQSMGMPQSPGAAAGSGSIGAMPNTPTSGSMGAMPQTLPPGHPSVGGGGGAPSGALPPGHPPVSPEKKTGQSK
jgi:hypothetical protein